MNGSSYHEIEAVNLVFDLSRQYKEWKRLSFCGIGRGTRSLYFELTDSTT